MRNSRSLKAGMTELESRLRGRSLSDGDLRTHAQAQARLGENKSMYEYAKCIKGGEGDVAIGKM